jgi:hypothetical protein
VEVALTLGVPPEDTVWLAPVADPAPEQRTAFLGWAGAPHPTTV